MYATTAAWHTLVVKKFFNEDKPISNRLTDFYFILKAFKENIHNESSYFQFSINAFRGKKKECL